MTASLAPGTAARADARRNRALVLAAAQRAFAEEGVSVSLAEVARRAGVGAGTVYRHFPTKADLLEAVMQQRVDRLATLATEYLRAPDAGDAFFDFCTAVIAGTPGNQALCDLVQSDDGWPRALLQSAGMRFHRALEALLAAAHRQGAVRADIELADVLAIFTGCVAIQQLRKPSGGVDRTAAIVLDALRARPGGPAVTKERSAVEWRNELADRNESDGAGCPVCHATVPRAGVGRRATYCSAACRQKAHRRRAAAAR
ncbi:TetR/AcrR family transcriptional regulator [Nocardia sp. NBC_00508]|uniref:TetR/AcrR family transcriptional regulator n=1 Tax=Nocardia sp. NBC_00508 TaxID=2975992 RepID=UPI002E800F4A|nr:helix-turn-helix domain-containing protein [Nocardia sp. NBC_00508]WUD64968.1 TetR/AcrR family transcriptional regulator [Nocardia sp. NBC_00508]